MLITRHDRRLLVYLDGELSSVMCLPRQNIRVFAGVSVSKTGEVIPTGVGRLCNWTPDPQQPSADEFVSFGAYQRTLSLACDNGDPGIVQWTPDANTPDTVYYQVRWL